METWKDIKGYEGLYQVSDLGNVRSLRFINNKVNKERIKEIKQNYSKRTKRYYVDLYKSRKRKHILVHKLVAETFIPNINNDPIINHKDGNPCNNKVENLEWCSYSYNSIHAYHTGLQQILKTINEQNKKAIIRNDGKTYSCLYECAREMNINPSAIRNNLKGRSKTCYGYKFSYAYENTGKTSL